MIANSDVIASFILAGQDPFVRHVIIKKGVSSGDPSIESARVPVEIWRYADHRDRARPSSARAANRAD
jgi:hypothetical protein